LGIKREEQDGWGGAAISGRVKFLLLAWGGAAISGRVKFLLLA